jgi:hypothetical protein
MYNSYKEVVWLVNIMNLNDNRPQIEVKDVFDSDGTFKTSATGEEIGKDLLERKATGYISFLRGENPYTFPYRIWPAEFSKENTFEEKESPRFQINGKIIKQNIEKLSLYLNSIGDYQQLGYDYIIKRLKDEGQDDSGRNMPSFENMESLGYILLQRPLESLNIVYPDERLTASEDPKFDSKDLVGKVGLSRIMSFKESASPPSRYDFEYRSDDFGRIFSPNEIGKYSAKIKSITNHIINSTGVILIYSQYIDGGLVPIALALEELGFTRAGSVRSLFKDSPTKPIDAITFRPRGDGNFEPAKYVMITGNKALSPDNVIDLKLATSANNKYGSRVKVILISQAGSEGLDFKFIRQVHVLEPWYNMNRIEQIIGRAVRTCSHKDLPFEERNVEILLHGTLLMNGEQEAADLYVYRHAELKAIQVGNVSRVLKEISVDCLLNLEQMGFTADEINQTVEQKLSSGKTIMYRVGDKPYTATCDYMKECSYECMPMPYKEITDLDVTLDTYSEPFIMMNTDKIIQKIKVLMKDRHFYKKKNLFMAINRVKTYPDMQVYAALNQLIEDKNEFISDKYGRLGNLVNIDDLYLFQPIELNNEHISVYDRSVPIEFKMTDLRFPLPNKVSEATVKSGKTSEERDKGKKIIKEMQEHYNEATTKHDAPKAADNWYKYCSLVIDKMEKEGVNKETLLGFLVAHIVEELVFEDIMLILNYLDLDTYSESDFEKRVKEYFKKNIITNKGITGMLLQNTGKSQLVVKKDNTWQLSESEDREDLKPQIDQLSNIFDPANEKLNKIVGFIANFKDYMVFKVKSINEKSHNKGARCDQSRHDIAADWLNQIIGEDKYSEFDKTVNQKEICVTQEFMLRLYNKEKKDGKYWFLTPVEAVLTKIEDI